MKHTKKKNGYTYRILAKRNGLYLAAVTDQDKVMAYECGRIMTHNINGKETEGITPNSAFGLHQADMYVPARLKSECFGHFLSQCNARNPKEGVTPQEGVKGPNTIQFNKRAENGVIFDGSIKTKSIRFA